MNNNTVTKEQINKIYNDSIKNNSTIFGKCYLMAVQLPSGFIIVESSACVDVENYNPVMGAEICKERIMNKIWELEGYRLQNELCK
jgi:hypothetical protein